MNYLKLGDLVYNQFEFEINSDQNEIFKIISLKLMSLSPGDHFDYECVNIKTGKIRIFNAGDIIIFNDETYNNQKLLKRKILKVLKKAFLLRKSIKNLENEVWYLGFAACSLSNYKVARLIPQLINNCGECLDQNLFLS
jgi:hypothetical protein